MRTRTLIVIGYALVVIGIPAGVALFAPDHLALIFLGAYSITVGIHQTRDMWRSR